MEINKKILFCKNRIQGLNESIERNKDINKMTYFYTEEEIINNKEEILEKMRLTNIFLERELIKEQELLKNLLGDN